MKPEIGRQVGSGQLQRCSVTVELCAGGIDDVKVAAECGIPRIELNSGMVVGGLTPSPGSIAEARQIFAGTIISMVRPREGGFCYSDAEFQQMLVDASLLIEVGCDGIAVGFLNADGTLHKTRCAEFRTRFPDTSLVFHRAFDVVRNPRETLDKLIELGFNRILTSGRMPSALDGAEEISSYREQAGARIEILPGGGIRAQNVLRVLNETGCNQLHTSARMRREDTSTQHNPALHFGGDASSPSGDYAAADGRALMRLLNEVNRLK